MSTDKPQIEKESEVDELTQVEREHEIILYNDDVNTFDHVINSLMAYCDHTLEQAEQCAYIVH
ncbi:MAG: ATP-dependent Clp protease adaptor ClpS [Flavobacteriaceae bacterium]|nr:ATP-dependent Clp protease adaptor ClpS [Flavobacteriaceae bacterium]